jgi:hypothetical protein
VLGKDTEQWEQVVRNSRTKNSVMEGQGTVGGMEKKQMEWRDKEQCEGKTRNRGVEGQGAMNERKEHGTFGGMEKNWKRKGQRTMLGRDNEQWERRTWSSVREGYGTVRAIST